MLAQPEWNWCPGLYCCDIAFKRIRHRKLISIIIKSNQLHLPNNETYFTLIKQSLYKYFNPPIWVDVRVKRHINRFYFSLILFFYNEPTSNFSNVKTFYLMVAIVQCFSILSNKQANLKNKKFLLSTNADKLILLKVAYISTNIKQKGTHFMVKGLIDL